MGTPTPRLGLLKPVGTELVNVITQIDAAYDKIDQWTGAILVNAGVTPPDSALFDGAIVKERVTDWTWVAEWNGSGYNKRYIGKAIQWDSQPISGTFTTGGFSLFDSGVLAAVDYDRLLTVDVCFAVNSFVTATFAQVQTNVNGTARIITRANQAGTVNQAAGHYRQLIAANATCQITATGTTNAGTAGITADIRFSSLTYSLEPLKS